MNMENLELRDIEGFRGFYSVTRDGNIYRFNKTIGHKKLKLKYSPTGHTYVNLSRKGLTNEKGPKCKNANVARAVAYAYLPNPNNYNEVRHIDGDKRNNHVDNLRWVEVNPDVRKVAPCFYKLIHESDPENIMYFDSRLKMEQYITKECGLPHKVSMSYRNLKFQGVPDKRGFMVWEEKIIGGDFETFVTKNRINPNRLKDEYCK